MLVSVPIVNVTTVIYCNTKYEFLYIQKSVTI